MRAWAIGALSAAAGLAALGLSACATMEPEQCAVADWRALGVQDGEAGRSLDFFEARTRDCAKAGFASDFNTYKIGREIGLTRYCVPARGFREGLSGAGYRGVCPADLAAEFQIAFNEGARAHDVLEAVRSAESDISSAQSRLDDLARKLRMNEDALDQPNVPEAERNRLRGEIDRLHDERRSTRRRLDDAYSRLRYARFDLERARAEIGLRWGAW
ncbi:MAG: DUF2799 domain-containing protein [Alphaproteobacteria bacterium]|nr:DUF2799 domain-containing protein [Alphaproteobacteria bacterium]